MDPYNNPYVNLMHIPIMVPRTYIDSPILPDAAEGCLSLSHQYHTIALKRRSQFLFDLPCSSLCGFPFLGGDIPRALEAKA